MAARVTASAGEQQNFALDWREEFSFALEDGEYEEALTIAKQLQREEILEQKGDKAFNALEEVLDIGRDRISNSIHFEIVKTLLVHIRPEELFRSHDQRTPFHIAASVDNAEIFKALLEHLSMDEKAAAMRTQDYAKNSPLHIAASLGHAEVIIAILECLPVSERMQAIKAKNREGDTPFINACYGEHEKVIQVLVVEIPQEERAKWILGEDVLLVKNPQKGREKWISGETIWWDSPLYFVVKKGNTKCFAALFEALPVDVRKMVIYSHDRDGISLLRRAALEGYSEIVEKILAEIPRQKRGKIVFEEFWILPENTYVLPLILLAMKEGHANVLQVLLEAVPERERENQILRSDFNKDFSLSQIAVSLGNADMVKILLEALPERKKMLAVCNPTPKPLAKLLLSLEEDIKQKNEEAHSNNIESLLIQAIQLKKFEIMEIILRAFPLGDERTRLILTWDLNGATALRMAVSGGQTRALLVLINALPEEMRSKAIFSSTTYLNLWYKPNTLLLMAVINRSIAMTNILLRTLRDEEKARIIAFRYSKSGETPLHIAAKNGDSEIAKALIVHSNSEIERIQNFDRKTPEQVARQRRHFALADMLTPVEANRRRSAALFAALDEVLVHSMPTSQELTPEESFS